MDADRDRLRRVDPEALAEVDFGRFVRAVGRYWWLVAAGSLLGAIVGFALAIVHGPTFRATTIVYLGLPYARGGEIPLQSLQTNSSAVDQIVHSLAIDARVGQECKTHSASFRNGISTQLSSGGGLLPNRQASEVTIAVLASTAKIAQCASERLARAAISLLSPYAESKVAGYTSQISDDQRALTDTKAALASGHATAIATLLLNVRVRGLQADIVSARGLLQQTEQVELPRILTLSGAEPVSARTRRASSVIGGLIGALAGVITLLGWAARSNDPRPAER